MYSSDLIMFSSYLPTSYWRRNQARENMKSSNYGIGLKKDNAIVRNQHWHFRWLLMLKKSSCQHWLWSRLMNGEKEKDEKQQHIRNYNRVQSKEPTKWLIFYNLLQINQPADQYEVESFESLDSDDWKNINVFGGKKFNKNHNFFFYCYHFCFIHIYNDFIMKPVRLLFLIINILLITLIISMFSCHSARKADGFKVQGNCKYNKTN